MSRRPAPLLAMTALLTLVLASCGDAPTPEAKDTVPPEEVAPEVTPPETPLPRPTAPAGCQTTTQEPGAIDAAGAGTVEVAVDDTGASLVDATPEPHWEVTVTDEGPEAVVVLFHRDDSEVQVEAEPDGDDVAVQICVDG